jgi:hypothetical protein
MPRVRKMTSQCLFGVKISPKTFQKLYDRTELEIVRAHIYERIYKSHTIFDQRLTSFVHFIQEETIKNGKEGNISYAIQGILETFFDLMKELEPTILEPNQSVINCKAAEVLWFLIILISIAGEEFYDFTFIPCGQVDDFLLSDVYDWIDGICIYASHHTLNTTTGVWKPKRDCIDITPCLSGIIDFLLCCTNIPFIELELISRNNRNPIKAIEYKETQAAIESLD